MSVIEFLSEPIWQRLGLTLLHFLWQGLAIAVLFGLIIRLFRLSRGNNQYIACLLAFLAMSACPVATFLTLDTSTKLLATPIATRVITGPIVSSLDTLPVLPVEDTQANTSIALPKIVEITEPVKPVSSIPLRERIADYLHTSLPWAISAWLVGVFLLSIRLLMGFVGVHRWRRRLEPLPDNLAQRVTLLAERLGLRSIALVLISPSAVQAVAIGYFRPMVLLPAAMITQMPPEMLEAVIAHELAHIRRFDLWINLLQRIAETLLFYHPALWWLSNRLRSERELCCDELAIQATGQRLTYASTLELAGRVNLTAKQPALVVSLGRDRKPILSRVRHVLGFAPASQNSRFWLAGLITVTFLAALAVPTALVLTAKAQTNLQAEPTATQKPAVQVEIAQWGNIPIKTKHWYDRRFESIAFVRCKMPIQMDESELRSLVSRKDVIAGEQASCVAIMRSESFLSQVLQRIKVRQTQWFQQYSKNPEKRIVSLKDSFSAWPIKNTEYVKVSMKVKKPKEAKLILDEVLKEFQQHSEKLETSPNTKPVPNKKTDLQVEGGKPVILGTASNNDVIFEAIELGDTARVQQYLAGGADINVRKDYYNAPPIELKATTPLILAMAFDNIEIIDLLIANGADVNAKAEGDVTPLLLSIFKKDKRIAELLLAHGADVNTKMKGGITLLHFAYLEGDKEIIDLLIANGADVNAKDENGLTPKESNLDISIIKVFKELFIKPFIMLAMQVEGEERESSNILRRVDSETSQSGRALLPEIASKVMIRFQKAIKDSDWTRALSYCSNKVKSKGKEYDSTEAFFKNVLPIDEITALSEFHISGMSRRNDDVISYRCEIRLKDPGSKYSLSWNLSVLKEDSNWVVDLPTKPLDVWLKHENLKMKWMNERYRFDEEKTQKGFDVRLVSLSEDFVVGKPMLFRVEMKNISNETLGYMHTSFINDPMLIKDSNGVIVHYIDTSYQTAEAPEFVEPAETIILADNYDARSQYHITRPGKYTFQFKGLANTKPSNIIEKDIQSSSLPALERIVEDLLPVLPEGWELTRTIRPANELAQTSTANEVLWIHLIGKQTGKGKGNSVSLAVFLYAAAQMPPHVKLKSNLSELDAWGNSKWGLIYAKSQDAELLWPDYKEKIKNVLQVAPSQYTSSGQVDINLIMDSELFIHYERAGLEEILIQDRELKHIWHTLKQNLTAMRQDISSYDRHEFTKKLNNDELLILRQWQLDNDIFLLPHQFPTADEITYDSAFKSSMKVKYDGRNYNAEWTGDSQLPKSVVRAVMELKRICKNLHQAEGEESDEQIKVEPTAVQVEGEGVGQKREDEQGNAYLDAIIEGNLGKVQELLADDPSLISIIDNRAKGSSRSPALHLAIKYGHGEIVELLLSKGAKPNERDINGQRSLHVVAENGRANMVKLLVQYGAGINDKNEFRLPPLCYASNAQVAEALIANGADVNWPDERRATPLHSIARSGITEVAQVLLAHGADINAKDNSGWTPLHSAAIRGRKDMVEFLITQGADINAKDRGTRGKTPLNRVVTDDWMVPEVDRKATAELLISHGADFTIYDVTWLGDVTRVRRLLEENPSLANDTTNTYREPALFAAIREGHSATAELLLDNGADLNVKDRYKEPPLHAAAYPGHKDMVALLISKGADVNQKGPHGELALHLASAKGHSQITQLLVEAGTEINTHTDKPRMDMNGVAEGNADVIHECLRYLADEAEAMRSGLQIRGLIRLAFAAEDTPLHSAAQRGHKEIVELLLANGADVNVTNRWGQTPLHYAVVFRHEEVVKALLNAGADPNAKMLDGSTAHDLASKVKDAELANMLRIEHNTIEPDPQIEGEDVSNVVENVLN